MAAPPRPPAPPAPPGTKQVLVRPGDTASRIAVQHRPRDISLDQMLMAMLHLNPHAFINGNVNLMKAGAVLVIPTEQQAAAINRQDASRMFELQVRDFNEYRRQLASMAREATPGGEAKKMQARVAQPPGSRLTLSDGALGTGQKVIAEHLAQQAERAAKLAAELKALAASQPASPASKPASAASRPAGPASRTGPPLKR